VGLGNPGTEHEQNRHNIGFWFVDALAKQAGASFRKESKFHGDVCRVTLHGHDVWLLKPGTYMNRSGQSVSAFASFYKISPDNILIVYDELDLPPGTARLKQDGGHGGHNGMRDVIAHLGTKNFNRLRIGIGHPGNSSEVADYILRNPSKSDREQIERALDDALRALPDVLDGDMQKAMHALHTEN